MKKTGKVTMSQIAKETGFSIATVSHVVNKTRFVDQETKSIILDAMERLNYIGKESYLPKQSKLIGMIIADIREDFYIELVKSAEVSAMENGFSLILCDAEDDKELEKFYLESLLERNVCGIILSPINQFEKPLILQDLDKPVILIDRLYSNTVNFDSITINNMEAGKILTELIFAKGAQSIGFIGYNDSVYTSSERKKGYIRALKTLNLKPEILELPYHQNKKLEWDIIKFITEGPRSVVCTTSDICFEVMNVVTEIFTNGIPENFYIGTFDESKWFRHISMPLTVIKQPTIEMGFIAVELLANKIYSYPLFLRKSKPVKKIVLDFEVIENRRTLP